MENIEQTNICPNCGQNPQDEPYCMSSDTHCPKCGYIFKDNVEYSHIATERKQQLLTNIFDYLYNYLPDFDYEEMDNCIKEVGVDSVFNDSLNYIIELLGSDANKQFFEEVLGFTEKEFSESNLHYDEVS